MGFIFNTVVFFILIYNTSLTNEGYAGQAIVKKKEQANAVKMWLVKVKYYLNEMGLWQSEMPETVTIASTVPFSADQLIFTEWLQWVFIPRLADIIDNQKPLPSGCCITPYAEEVLRFDEKGACKEVFVKKLIDLIKEIDQLLA